MLKRDRSLFKKIVRKEIMFFEDFDLLDKIIKKFV